MKKLFLSVFTFILVLSFVGCSSGNSTSSNNSSSNSSVGESDTPSNVTISHFLGEVEVPYDPQRIVTLDLAALDVIDALGLGDRVVGMPKQSQVEYLMSYNNNEDVAHLGSLFEVDMEKLVSLKPDIIFIGGRLSDEYENISKIAPTVLFRADNEAGYIKSLDENLNEIASIFGKESDVKDIINDFNTRIDKIKEEAADKTAIVGLVTSSSFNTLGKTGRCSIISNEAGFENIADDIDSTHGDTASFELLVDKNPNYIFVLERDSAINAKGAQFAEQVMDNELVAKTDAHKSDQIIYLTPDAWYLAEGGITATDIMIKDLEKGILGE